MNSSQTAQAAFVALTAVSAMLLTSVQLRVLARPAPRHRAYVVGWLVAVSIIGGLLSLADFFVGDTGSMRRLLNVGIAALVTSLGLAAGRAFGRDEWATAPKWAMVGTLLLSHALVVLVVRKVLT